MALNETELAFAENLILLGAVTGPHMLYPILLKETDPRPLWEIASSLQVADPAAIQQAYTVAQSALAAAGAQAFSFSEGAMVGAWELLAGRGQGIGGEVWLASRDGQEATLRLITPGTGHDKERAARFVERSNAGLDPPHPAILKIDEADEDFGWLYTVTVGMDCRSLAAVRAPGPLPEATALALAQSLAGSLAVIHDLGVVHGGITPLGVLIRESRTYLSDFGLCSARLDGTIEGCRPGGRLGVLLYSSPELISGNATRGLDASDDLFALGAVVLHAISAPGSSDQRVGPDSPWLVQPPISPGFLTVLGRLLCRHPGGRYSTARSLLEDLARLADAGAPDPLPPPSAGVRGRRAETAAPQQLVQPEMFERLKAPSGGDIQLPDPEFLEDEPAELAETFDGEEPYEVEVEYELEAEEDTRRESQRFKAPSKKKGVSQRLDQKPVKKGGGWLLFTFALLLVGGFAGLAYTLTQPVGPQLARTLLSKAEGLADGEAPDYGKAADIARLGIAASTNDPTIVRDLLAFIDGLDRRAQQDRVAFAKAIDKLEDLRTRSAGLAVEHLVQLDLYVAEKQGNRHFWGELADELLAVGHLDAALTAYKNAGSDRGQEFVKQAKATLGFVRGGPYLVAGEDGKLAVVERKPCYLGRTEVTRGQYAAFLAAIGKQENPHGKCDPLLEPEGKDHAPEGWTVGVAEEANLPATGVDLHDAAAYAAWCKSKLTVCDAQTLTAAARGPAGLTFPWGAEGPALSFANVGGLLGSVTPAGSFPGGVGVGGVLDLLGNVAEWTSDKDAGQAVVFGGHYDTPLEELAAGASGGAAPDERRPTLGFRVMKVLETRE